MTERIKKMMQDFNEAHWPLCSSRLQSFWRTWELYSHEPRIVQRGKYQVDYLDTIPVSISEHEQIAGRGASEENGVEVDYALGCWQKKDLEDLLMGTTKVTVSKENMDIICDIMEKISCDKRIKTQTLYFAEQVVDHERMWPFVKTGVVLPPWTKDKIAGASLFGNAGSGLNIGPLMTFEGYDFSMVINRGVRSMIDEAKKCIENHRFMGQNSVEKRQYWMAEIESMEAWIRYAHRCADAANAKAQTCTDECRKTELLEMARICRKIPELPAESFREAVQAWWFTFLISIPAQVSSFGRPDQFLYPFYKRDIESGKITDDQVIEILQEIRVKAMQHNGFMGAEARKRQSGNAKWYNCILGGLNPDGTDASNELTMLFMDAALEMHYPHHTLTLRINEKTPDKVILKALELIKSGLGFPALVSDKAYIDFFHNSMGLDVKDACDFSIVGCLDGATKKTVLSNTKFINVALMLEAYLHNGFNKLAGCVVGLETGNVAEKKTWNEFLEGFEKQLNYMLSMACEFNNLELQYKVDYLPNIFHSIMIDGGIKSGKDYQKRYPEIFCGGLMSILGGIDCSDALVAIKKLIYDEQKYQMKDLLTALDADWIGFDEMRKDFLAAPKYGNNNDEADDMAVYLYDKFDRIVESYQSAYGGHFVPEGISISSHAPGGAITGALPNGRKSGDALTDGSISPERGFDLNGCLAVLQSGMKLHQSEMNATLLNMKFHPSAMKTDDDLKKLAAAIKVYLLNGGKHIQINVVDRNTLEDAVVNPEKHKDLLVRVAGYSAYFTALTPQVQSEVIGRTSFENI